MRRLGLCRHQRICSWPPVLVSGLLGTDALRSPPSVQQEAVRDTVPATPRTTINNLDTIRVVSEDSQAEVLEARATVQLEALLKQRPSKEAVGLAQDERDFEITVHHVGARPAHHGGRHRRSDSPPGTIQLVLISLGLLSLLVCSCACLAVLARAPPASYVGSRGPREEKVGSRGLREEKAYLGSGSGLSASGGRGPEKHSSSERLSLNCPSTWRWSNVGTPGQQGGPPGRDEPLGGARGESDLGCSSGSEAGDQPPAMVLCPLLLVPNGTRLDCVVATHFCAKKQQKTFNVCGLSGAQLFQVRAAEHPTDNACPGIYMETLSGTERLAYLSTEELWKGVARPKMGIFHAWGNQYGTMQKTEEGAYEVRAFGGQDDETMVLKFVGDFVGNSYKVIGKSGRTVALISPSSGGVKKVVVHSRNDAGLMILGILAIDKCEMPADRDSPSGTGSSPGA